MTMNLKTASYCIAALLMSAGISSAVSAQSGSDTALPKTGLNLPDQLTIFGKSDPNNRSAAVKINGEIITGTDVDHRLALIVLANGGKVSEEERKRLQMQVLRNLIDETLQIQEAKANEITIDQAEVDQTFARVSQQSFKQAGNKFNEYLVSKGSSPLSLKRQILGELAWDRLLRRKVNPFVNVANDEVNAVIERLKNSKGSTEYRLGEIYLSATSENEASVVENMKRIIEQLRKGGSFAAYARQFSEASTAAVGGDLGWIRLEQLPQSLSSPAAGMQIGQIVGPIGVPGGYSLLFMIDRRQILTADPRDSLLSLKQIAISFKPDVSQADATAQVEQFSNMTKAISGCGAANAAATKIGATVVDNDRIKVRDLPPQLQDSLLKLQVGQASQPFGSIADGVRVLVLCGRDDPEASGGPSFDQIMNRMEGEKVNRRAQIYLRDLRRDAIIDYN